MPRYKVTYYREYETEVDDENDALGITDQEFTNDIRKVISELGNNKIIHFFKFSIERIKKNGEIKRKIEKSEC